MNKNEKHFFDSKVLKYFDKNLLKNKIIRDTLISFEEILSIRKNIRIIYGTDNPDDIKLLIDKKINNIMVSQKDFDYVLLINNTYHDLYHKCKNLLEDIKN